MGCVIRISKILLYAIHNMAKTSWMFAELCYQDFKDTFVCNTQPLATPSVIDNRCVIRISKILLYAIHNLCSFSYLLVIVVLSGFQRYFCMQYTTIQQVYILTLCCVIRISKILLYAIHNLLHLCKLLAVVVLSGFQRYFCMQYTTPIHCRIDRHALCYQDFKDTFVCNTQLVLVAQ